jgi:hypothetical protein
MNLVPKQGWGPTATGIRAAAREAFAITASGTVNLADRDGSYIVNASGTIVKAPPAGSGAYGFFKTNAGPIGVPPVAGATKLAIISLPNPFDQRSLWGLSSRPNLECRLRDVAQIVELQ